MAIIVINSLECIHVDQNDGHGLVCQRGTSHFECAPIRQSRKFVDSRVSTGNFEGQRLAISPSNFLRYGSDQANLVVGEVCARMGETDCRNDATFKLYWNAIASTDL